MTELNLLYGDDNLLNDNNIIERKEPTYSSKISSQQIHQLALNNDHNSEDKQMMHPAQSQAMQISQQQMAQQMAQQQAQQMAQQQIQQHMMQPQQAVHPQNNNEQAYKKKNEYNFIDRMNFKKSEVIKLALFSLVIVLGISVDRMLT